MEDAFHCNSDGLVVGVDRFWVVRPAGWVERLSGGEEGFDSFVSEDEQRSHRSESLSPNGFTASDVAARVRAFSKQSPCQYGPRHPAYDLKKLRGKCLPGMRYLWVANRARKGPRRVLMETTVARLVSR
jgi:hypothetical protein